ncbi:hypothetical protein MSAN_02306800 [Mycena sanguinolenta]|uniref:Uncharacterized protein n=1 Tax=Mycena sanguinolenta TaxID=230812 RepID=A0A8H7CFZ3_9AGAR|nr:hypothetical protein MSAN_02306800 [Mycena sanguinolenta]
MARLRIFFGGRGLSALSKALLQSRQHFYLLAVAANVALLVVLKLPQLTVYRVVASVPAFALINAMACQVFREIKFRLISSDGTSNIPTLDFHVTADPRSLSVHFHRTDPTTTELGSNTISLLEVLHADGG